MTLLTGWLELADPAFWIALTGFVTSLAGVITALRAHNTAGQAKQGAVVAKKLAETQVPPLAATVSRNTALIPVLNARISSLEESFQNLLAITEQNGDGAQRPVLPPSLPDGATGAGPPG